MYTYSNYIKLRCLRKLEKRGARLCLYGIISSYYRRRRWFLQNGKPNIRRLVLVTISLLPRRNVKHYRRRPRAWHEFGS